jgi:cytochrome c oxidase assembly protein Cox11
MFARHRLLALARNARWASSSNTAEKKTNTTLLYLASATVLAVGASYAAVPLYRLFCQVRRRASAVIFEL